MRHILLVRHFESEKNIAKRFSKADESDELSADAIRQLRKEADGFASFLNEFGVQHVYCSESVRARQSALALTCNSERITITGVKEFNSIVYHPDGISESDAMRTSPTFIHALELYRKGLLSSYEIPTMRESEPVSDFESRVRKAFSSIMDNVNGDIIPFFLHRSPITALLVGFARAYHNYPKDFFGYVELDCGKCSLIRMDDRSGAIVNVNVHIDVIRESLVRGS